MVRQFRRFGAGGYGRPANSVDVAEDEPGGPADSTRRDAIFEVLRVAARCSAVPPAGSIGPFQSTTLASLGFEAV